MSSFLLTFSVLIFCLTVRSTVSSEFTLSEKCSKCRVISRQFKDGLLKTAKSNFGGGNTDWEEKKLKSFTTSETRFIEIHESLCSSDKFCSLFLESHEEPIENWWFENKELLRSKSTTEQGVEDIHEQFVDFLCIRESSVCCHNNTFGKSCTPCPTVVSGKSCSGNGNCDGEGTRSGNGKCQCSQGYTGEECAVCSAGYFSESSGNSESVNICTSCELNCDDCTSGGPGECKRCRSGFSLEKVADGDELGSCKDIDECSLSDENPCKTPSTYCVNTPGSYKCVSCDSACDTEGCTGSGPSACIGGCNNGYRKVGESCEDIDECSEAEASGTKLCGESKEGNEVNPICVNIPGTFRCSCSSSDYEYGDGVCTLRDPEGDGEDLQEAKRKYSDNKAKKPNKKKKSSPKPVSNKSSQSKVAAALETDFSLVHFCAILVGGVVVISFLANKPRPWPVVAFVLVVLLAVYVYNYVGQHDPKGESSQKTNSRRS